jgi:hypothetical protein
VGPGNACMQLEDYQEELEEMKNLTRQEYVAHLRRYRTTIRSCTYTHVCPSLYYHIYTLCIHRRLPASRRSSSERIQF